MSTVAACSRSPVARSTAPTPLSASSSSENRRRGVCPLEHLAERPLRLVDAAERQRTKEELLRDVWGFRSQGRTRTLDSHASRLRRRLTRPGSTPYVHNVWGVSYCLLGD